MGKGNRSRDGRNVDDSILTKTQKTKKQKKGRRPMPKWIVPTLVAIVAIAVVFAIVFSALINNGVFKRNNVLVKSQQQNKYNLNQLSAQIMLWYSGWMQGQNAYYSTISTSAEYNQNTEFSWCWAYAGTSQSNLHDVVKDSAAWLEELVALCDWGMKNNIPFTAEDEETAYDSFVSAFKSQAKSYYKYAYDIGFSNENGETEKYPYDYSSYVDYPSYPYFSGFIRNVFGNGIKSEDFRRAANILTYASRVKTLKAGEFWNADAETIAEELKKNPDLYYTMDYLKFAADDSDFADQLKAASSADEFKKLIVEDYIKNNYFGEYNKLFADALLKSLKDKTGEELAAALEENGLTVVDFEKPAEEPADEEGSDDAEPTEGEGDAEGGETQEGESEEGDETGETTSALTQKQSDWLFDKNRAANDMDIVTEEDESATLLVITEVTKDDEGNVTAVKAVVKNFSEVLSEEDYYALINEVCHHLDLPHDHEAHAHDEEGEQEGDAEPIEGEGEGEEAAEEEIAYWDDLVEAMESGANSKLPSESTIYYVKAVDLEKEIDELKTGLEEAEDKAAYLQEKGIAENLGMAEDKVDEALKAVLFPAEGTVEAGSILIVDADDGDTKHLVYVTEVKTEGEGEEEKTLVSFYDYSVSKYSNEFSKFLFEGVNEETMTGAPEVNATFVGEDEKTVYIITKALDLGKDAVRGGYISYSDKETADADLKKLEGLTGIELLNKLAEINSSATTSNKITETAVSSADLKAWLFDETRKANDAAVVYQEDEDGNILNGIYLAVFLDKTSAGESDARTNIADEKADDFARKLAEDGGYKLSEKALAKIK